MSTISRSVAALRVFGDDLVPTEVALLLGSSGTESYSKGDTHQTSTGHTIIRKLGMWCIEASASEPENLDSQVAQILARLTSDMKAWHVLCDNYQVDLFCGLFMAESSEGFSLSAATLSALVARGIEIRFELYAPERPINPLDPCPCGSGANYAECCAPSTQLCVQADR